jgi:cytochrome d ubiquinol oxidase subunit II
MPLTGVLFLVGVLLVLYGILISLLKKTTFGIWFSGIGTVLTVFSLLLIAGLNHTAYYPSTFNLQHSLTIENSSSSHYTLTAMSYVSLLVPFVLIYIIYAWNAINKKPISLEEVKEESHLY